MPFFLRDPVAHWIVVAAAAAVVVGELSATARGRARNRTAPALRSPLPDKHDSDGAFREDNGTRLIVALSVAAGIAASLAIAYVSALRSYADNWWAFGVAIALVLTGAVLRDWAIISLGGYFRRTVTIEPEQRIVRRGPYRLLRHPAYTGLVLIFTGFGLSFGSWVGAAAAFAIVLAGLLPRIRVEERALTRAFGSDYSDYAAATARLLPHVW